LNELTSAQFPIVRTLFDEMDYHLAVNSIFTGQTPARIFVDDAARPCAAIAWAGHRFHLAGLPHDDGFNQALGALFSQTIYPHSLAQGDLAFSLYYAPEEWADAIDVILPGKYPLRTMRQYYACSTALPPQADWRAMLPQGFSLHNVDEALLAQTHLQRMDDLREEMCSERPSVQDFLAKSFGVCLVKEDALAGWCLSEYNSPGRCEVGIETSPAYRRQGLGTLMALALLERAHAKGIQEVGWHCYASNVASGATALRAGFHLVHDYPAYYAWFNAVDNLVVHGNLCQGQQQYAEAADWYERAFALGEAKSWGYWGAACNAAALGRADQALNYLGQAIAKDPTIDAARLQAEARLQSLHTLPAWQELIAERSARKS
jgi:RimJ/RimL family protein N-acetyltransferase